MKSDRGRRIGVGASEARKNGTERRNARKISGSLVCPSTQFAHLKHTTTSQHVALTTMAASERYPVSVKINFHIQGDKSSTQSRRTFDASNCEPATLGLSEGRTPTKVRVSQPA